ncbi:four-carbon acid sugar kinase family protein [Roseococcus sp. DSY-14]|uniref:four-carbon acid sugar kinase family protein n=1 Tax=Roseococcus sp. DSY-14 TaxID=3369650 RepID=UPI00387AAA99
MRLRLLADDLSGALDSAAEFAALCGPVPLALDGPPLAAMDSATREAPRALASARVAALAPHLAGADIAFKKLDSLLRGQVATELAACWATGAFRHLVLAPAFPAQGRVTRAGRVLSRQGAGWRPHGDLGALLRGEGLRAAAGDPLAPLPDGIAIFDAETEADLARVAALGATARGPVLWAGSGGLARALAAAAPVAFDRAVAHPVLGCFGSDRAETAAQLAACGPALLAVTAGDAPRIAARLARGPALLSVALPSGLHRAEAAARIAATWAALLPALPRPATLLAAGGETLRAACLAVGARGLLATGLAEPGVPRAALVGGTWDGVAVISKSGAFGGPSLWRDLLFPSGDPA